MPFASNLFKPDCATIPMHGNGEEFAVGIFAERYSKKAIIMMGGVTNNVQ